jgi:two-component system OmpR family sensor kinase
MIMAGETDLANEICKACGEVAYAHIAPPNQHPRLVAELTQAVHARDAFIAIAAHELRNPMTPMLGYVEHILSVGRRPETECPKAIIVALERLANQMGEYIKRATTLLDVSRLTAGKLRAELSVVDLSAMMEQAVYRHPAGAERGLPPRTEHRRRGDRVA